jgi:hypothetical protein
MSMTLTVAPDELDAIDVVFIKELCNVIFLCSEGKTPYP